MLFWERWGHKTSQTEWSEGCLLFILYLWGAVLWSYITAEEKGMISRDPAESSHHECKGSTKKDSVQNIMHSNSSKRRTLGIMKKWNVHAVVEAVQVLTVMYQLAYSSCYLKCSKSVIRAFPRDVKSWVGVPSESGNDVAWTSQLEMLENIQFIPRKRSKKVTHYNIQIQINK